MAKKKKRKGRKQTPKILIGVPILDWSHEFATSFIKFWTDLMVFKHEGRKFHVGYKFVYRKPVHMAEEELAQTAVDSGCTHLLLMDDDIYDVTAQDLMKLLDAGKDVIGGIMFAGGFPYAMCAFRRYDLKTKVSEQPVLKGPSRLYEIPQDQRHGVQKADLIPFAFTLMKTKVFKGMEKPWFKCNTQAPTDSWFADSLLASGKSYHAHFGVWLNHKGINRYNRPYYYQMGLAKAQREKKAGVINLTPQEMAKHEAVMTMKMQEAERKAKALAIKNMDFYEKDKGATIAMPLTGKR